MKSLQLLIREYGQAREHFGWSDCFARKLNEDIGPEGDAELERDRRKAEQQVKRAWKAICNVLEIEG